MSEQDILGTQCTAALALSRELGGARVTMRSGMSPEVAAALGREIRAGLVDGPGPGFSVEAITVEDNPPRMAVTITIQGAQP